MLTAAGSWQFSPRDFKSEFQNTVVPSQMATKATILCQSLPLNYILGHQMPQILLIFLALSLTTESKQKQTLAKYFGRQQESLMLQVKSYTPHMFQNYW